MLASAFGTDDNSYQLRLHLRQDYSLQVLSRPSRDQQSLALIGFGGPVADQSCRRSIDTRGLTERASMALIVAISAHNVYISTSSFFFQSSETSNAPRVITTSPLLNLQAYKVGRLWVERGLPEKRARENRYMSGVSPSDWAFNDRD